MNFTQTHAGRVLDNLRRLIESSLTERLEMTRVKSSRRMQNLFYAFDPSSPEGAVQSLADPTHNLPV